MWTKLIKRLWAELIDIKDFVIVKIWGFFYGLFERIKENPSKAVINTLIFVSTVVILEEVFAIYFCGGLSVFGILAVIVFGTLLAYTILRRRAAR